MEADSHGALVTALGHALGPVLGEDVEIDDLRPMPGGSSRQTWSFSARLPAGGHRTLVVRRDRAAPASATLALEAAVIEAAGAAGVPVPAVLAAPAGGDPGTCAFVVMDRVDGETIPRRVLRLVEREGTGEALAAQCGRILAAAHALEPSSVPGLPGGDPLEQLRGVLDLMPGAHPVLEAGLRYLAAGRPPRWGDAVVHGDFRTGNLVVGPEGVRAVLDWELAHRGDPLEDLGWLCARAWRFGSPLPVGGFGRLDTFLAAYESAAGRPVDTEALVWWEAFASLRWGVICLVQAAAHLSGAVRSVELAAIGRRVCEAEWDLLSLLRAGPADVPGSGHATAPGDAPGEGDGAPGEEPSFVDVPHDGPGAQALLGAVEELLRDEVVPPAERRRAFDLRVAANVLAMVQRQLALGPAQAVRHRRRLAVLGVGDDAELATAIRSGAFDGRGDELLAVLRLVVADKLAVANPAYAGEGASP